MQWSDEGYLLSKNNFDENSIIIETFTLEHGKYSGIVYGGASRKNKKNFQIGNKILLNWTSKGENRSGYFNIELIKPVAPLYFEDKKKSFCILASTSILKILLPERQTNKHIYDSFEEMINKLSTDKWIYSYILWEFNLIRHLGYEINFLDSKNKIKDSVNINGRKLQIPKIFINKKENKLLNAEIKEALNFNKVMLIENFIIPYKLKFPLFRNILESFYI